MWALTISDKELELAERDEPEPGPYDVVVAVHAAGINAADLLQRQGFYPAPAGWPVDVPGMELAGVVSAVGDRVVEPLLGRRVCAVVGGGAQATHCVVPAEHLLFLPDDVAWDQAGGFPEAFTTAYDALATQGNLLAGERVLISGAAGGVGVAGVQIAHALGAHVTAVTRTNEFHDALRELGADDTTTLEAVATIEPVDVVLELVGAAHLEMAQRVLSPFARVVVIGVGSGSRVELDLLGMMRSRTTFTGSTLRSRSREEKAGVARLIGDALLPRWTRGELTVPLARVFDLRDGGDAYDYFAQPGKFGKVVLRMNEFASR
ncbi:MAG TPA: zinc-binding dehydrogenase [Acidimicrobiales bacterium]|nr:zinc-binding dehydrogenase [Acidimicrobiales bacterium]